MRELIEEVLLLQESFSDKKTPDMDRRGIIVRQEMRQWLEGREAALRQAIAGAFDDLAIEGRDGTGRKTEIPWIRLYSRERSPSATEGWFVVYLFSAKGDRCCLALNHGSTTWDGVEFRPRSAQELAALVGWARSTLKVAIPLREDLATRIELDARRSNLGPSYEASTAFAMCYELDAIPPDGVLITDLQYMLQLLSLLYRAEASDPRIPGAVPAEVAAVEEVLGQYVGKPPRRRGRGGGQGFGLTKEEQQAIDDHAMKLALAHYGAERWERVDDVSKKESFDIRAVRAEHELHIEVKGSTSLGEAVILTPNEVTHQRRQFPHNALFLVHSIQLTRRGDAPSCSGGIIVIIAPWHIADEALRPISFKYAVPLDMATQPEAHN